MARLSMEPAPSPWRTRSFLAAAVVVALVVVLGLWVVVRGPASPAPTATRTAGSVPLLRVAPAPHLAKPGSSAIPTSSPPGITWQPYQGVLLPYSSSAGPRVVTASLATGYAHTPVGALVAAVQIDYRHLLAPDWQAVTEAQVVAGAGRTAYVAVRTQASTASSLPPSTGTATPSLRQLAGFDMVSYSPSEAVVQVVTVGTDASFLMVPLTVRWIGGDWQLQLTDQGGDGPEAEPLSTLAGFVTWGVR